MWPDKYDMTLSTAPSPLPSVSSHSHHFPRWSSSPSSLPTRTCLLTQREEYDFGLNHEVCAVQLIKDLLNVTPEEMSRVVLACTSATHYITYALFLVLLRFWFYFIWVELSWVELSWVDLDPFTFRTKVINLFSELGQLCACTWTEVKGFGLSGMVIS